MFISVPIKSIAEIIPPKKVYESKNNGITEPMKARVGTMQREMFKIRLSFAKKEKRIRERVTMANIAEIKGPTSPLFKGISLKYEQKILDESPLWLTEGTFKPKGSACKTIMAIKFAILVNFKPFTNPFIIITS